MEASPVEGSLPLFTNKDVKSKLKTEQGKYGYKRSFYSSIPVRRTDFIVENPVLRANQSCIKKHAGFIYIKR